MMNIKQEIGPIDVSRLDIADKWILTRLNRLIEETTDCIEITDLGLAAQKIYDFTWNEFCDWYIEMAKPRLYEGDGQTQAQTMNLLVYVLKNTLKLLHPFMPFITEEIYTSLPGSEETIMTSAWPTAEFKGHDQPAEMMQNVMDLIRSIRNLRAEMNVPPSIKASLTVLTDHGDAVAACSEYLKKLAYASDVSVITQKEEVPKNTVSAVCSIGEAFLPLGELIDVQKEQRRLEKELAQNSGEIKRAQGKLNNKGFTDKAPAHVVEEERKKLEKYIDLEQKLQERIAFLENMEQ